MLIIGIAGGTGSGKTTVVRKIIKKRTFEYVLWDNYGNNSDTCYYICTGIIVCYSK